MTTPPQTRAGLDARALAGDGKEELTETNAVTSIDLSGEDVVRLQALAMFGSTVLPGEPMREWCRSFYLRLLPLRFRVKGEEK